MIYKPEPIKNELDYFIHDDLVSDLLAGYKDEIRQIAGIKALLEKMIQHEKRKFLKTYKGNNREADWIYHLWDFQEMFPYQGLHQSLREHSKIAENLLVSSERVKNHLRGEEGEIDALAIEMARQVPIESVIQLENITRKSGKIWANCPFHKEKTPSFCIYPLTNTWYCFGACVQGGDAINFYMKAYNASFPEAVRSLNNS